MTEIGLEAVAKRSGKCSVNVEATEDPAGLLLLWFSSFKAPPRDSNLFIRNAENVCRCISLGTKSLRGGQEQETTTEDAEESAKGKGLQSGFRACTPTHKTRPPRERVAHGNS